MGSALPAGPAACRLPLSNAAVRIPTPPVLHPLPAEAKSLAAGDAEVIEASGQQIIVRNDGTLVIVPGNGSQSSLSGPPPRSTAETEYLTGGCWDPRWYRGLFRHDQRAAGRAAHFGFACTQPFPSYACLGPSCLHALHQHCALVH